MFVGNVLAIQQSNIKRMLAYSSIAQAGTILIGLAAISADRGDLLGAGGILFYLAGYTVTNLTAFLVIIIVHEKIGSFQIDDYRGLGRRAPLLSAVLALALLSLTGLPVTAGFFGKLYLFDIAIQSDLAWLAAIGVVNTVISAAYYIRPIKAMFVDDPAADEPATARAQGVASWLPSPPLGATLALTTAGIVVIGLAPGLLIDVAEEAVSTIIF